MCTRTHVCEPCSYYKCFEECVQGVAWRSGLKYSVFGKSAPCEHVKEIENH